MRNHIRRVLAITALPAFVTFALLGWILPPICIFALLGAVTLISHSFKYLFFDLSARERERCKEEIREGLGMTFCSFWMAYEGFIYIFNGKS